MADFHPQPQPSVNHAKFFVKRTFELPEQKLFVMAGVIVEDEIKVGMFLHVPFNPSLSMTTQVERIEFARRSDGEDVCLIFQSEPEMADLWRGLNIRDETFEVTTEGNI